jgi:hypothetical protein
VAQGVEQYGRAPRGTHGVGCWGAGKAGQGGPRRGIKVVLSRIESSAEARRPSGYLFARSWSAAGQHTAE